MLNLLFILKTDWFFFLQFLACKCDSACYANSHAKIELDSLLCSVAFLRRFLLVSVKNCNGCFCKPMQSWITRGHNEHTEKSFRNLIKSTRNQIVFTIFRLIWIQTDVRLDPNQSEDGNYNLISGWFNKISLCVPISHCQITVVQKT